MLNAYPDWTDSGPRHRDHSHRGSRQGDGQGAHRTRVRRRSHLPEMGVRVSFLEDRHSGGRQVSGLRARARAGQGRARRRRLGLRFRVDGTKVAAATGDIGRDSIGDSREVLAGLSAGEARNRRGPGRPARMMRRIDRRAAQVRLWRLPRSGKNERTDGQLRNVTKAYLTRQAENRSPSRAQSRHSARATSSR